MRKPLGVLIGIMLLTDLVGAQPEPLTLGQAVQQSVENPAVRGSLEQVSAAASGINLARMAYLPRADFLGQVNRATHNNVFGLLLAQAVIPSISGPAQGTNSLNNVWGSAVGTLVSWEPVDFGLRKANVETAKAARDRAAAEVNVTKLQVATAAADAFLTIAAAQQTVVAARAGVERARAFNDVIETLAKNELRPGADASRSRAEFALAQTQQIQAEQAVAVARAALAQLLGTKPENIVIEPGPLLQAPAAPQILDFAATQHPLAVAREAAMTEVKAREKALDRLYYPRLYLQGAAYARGTGIQPNGRTRGVASGVGPNIQNWALGRNVHPGALVGTARDTLPMFQLETQHRLRLVVSVPETDIGGIVKGGKIAFTVPVYPGETFYGTLSRSAHSIDPKTRSMPVELDVSNPKGRLAAGIYPAVKWPIHGNQSVLLLPPTSIVTTSERTFVIRVNGGAAEWVDVKKGPAQGDLVEIIGPVKEGTRS